MPQKIQTKEENQMSTAYQKEKQRLQQQSNKITLCKQTLKQKIYALTYLNQAQKSSILHTIEEHLIQKKEIALDRYDTTELSFLDKLLTEVQQS
jgi:hypothetical protein